MTLEPTTVQIIFAAAEVVLGVAGFVTGQITFGGESGDDDTHIIGSNAKILSGSLIVTGIVTLFHTSSGFTLLLVTLITAYVFSRRAGA
jgi:hypothetical protein